MGSVGEQFTTASTDRQISGSSTAAASPTGRASTASRPGNASRSTAASSSCGQFANRTLMRASPFRSVHPWAPPRPPLHRWRRACPAVGRLDLDHRLVGLDLRHAVHRRPPVRRPPSARRSPVPSLTVRSPNGMVISTSSAASGGRLAAAALGAAAARPRHRRAAVAARSRRAPVVRHRRDAGEHLPRASTMRPVSTSIARSSTGAKGCEVANGCSRPTGASSSSKASSLIACAISRADAAHRPGLVHHQQVMRLAHALDDRLRRRAA